MRPSASYWTEGIQNRSSSNELEIKTMEEPCFYRRSLLLMLKQFSCTTQAHLPRDDSSSYSEPGPLMSSNFSKSIQFLTDQSDGGTSSTEVSSSQMTVGCVKLTLIARTSTVANTVIECTSAFLGSGWWLEIPSGGSVYGSEISKRKESGVWRARW